MRKEKYIQKNIQKIQILLKTLLIKLLLLKIVKQKLQAIGYEYMEIINILKRQKNFTLDDLRHYFITVNVETEETEKLE